jgi:hypothetical protein
MKDVKPMAKAETADLLCELDCSQLTAVTGGSLSVVSGVSLSAVTYDDYCGNGRPRPPHFQLVTSLVSAVNPAVTQQFGMGQG